MHVSLEALLQPLYEVERDAYFADLPQDTTQDVTALHKAIIVDSLTNVKNFMSSFGIVVKDFFDQDKSRFSYTQLRVEREEKVIKTGKDLPTGRRNLLLCKTGRSSPTKAGCPIGFA